MRPFSHSVAAMLIVSAAALLPSALHAQAIGRMGRPSGPSAPAQSAPAPQQSAPAQNAPSYPQNAPSYQQTFTPSYQTNAPSYQTNAPQQYTPSRGAPIFNRQVTPNRTPVITQYPEQGTPYRSRGPVFSRPSYPTERGRPMEPSGQTYSPPAYQYNNNAPVFNSQTNFHGRASLRVTTPTGPVSLPRNGYYPIYGGGYNYGGDYGYGYGGGYGSGVTVVGGPVLLGGFYYGNYCDTAFGVNTYPSIYSAYSGFPTYIYSPASVIVLTEPYQPVYNTGYLPFYTPSYPVVYNQNTYYVGSEERAQQIVGDNEAARKAALQNAYPEGSYQAAFGDIERAWIDGNVAGLQKHLRGNDVKLSVFFKGKYSYSIATGDYVQITRDAFDKLSTVSFKFDRLRKAKNGDVTAFGTHVYRSLSGTDTAGGDGTVPFSTDGGGVSSDNTTNAAPGVEKTINVAYTLRHQGGQWVVVAIDSTPAAAAK